MDIQGQIRDVLAKALRAEGDRAVSDQELLSELQRRGIVEDTMKQLTFTNTVRVLFSAQVSLVMFQTGSPVVDETSLPQDHSSLKRLVVSSGAHGSYNPGFWRGPPVLHRLMLCQLFFHTHFNTGRAGVLNQVCLGQDILLDQGYTIICSCKTQLCFFFLCWKSHRFHIVKITVYI